MVERTGAVFTDAEIEARRIREREAGRAYAAKEFGIPIEEVVWYHHGICYSSVVVTTQSAADKVTEHVKGGTVNGGWFHGMPLGGQEGTGVPGQIRITC